MKMIRSKSKSKIRIRIRIRMDARARGARGFREYGLPRPTRGRGRQLQLTEFVAMLAEGDIGLDEVTVELRWQKGAVPTRLTAETRLEEAPE